MIYPPLPEPTIIDGRRLYTAGQMREYAELAVHTVDQSRIKNNASGQPKKEESLSDSYSKAIGDIFGIMGIKK